MWGERNEMTITMSYSTNLQQQIHLHPDFVFYLHNEKMLINISAGSQHLSTESIGELFTHSTFH